MGRPPTGTGTRRERVTISFAHPPFTHTIDADHRLLVLAADNRQLVATPARLLNPGDRVAGIGKVTAVVTQ